MRSASGACCSACRWRATSSTTCSASRTAIAACRSAALLRRLQPNDRAVGLAAAVANLGREIEVAVRALLDVAEAHVHLRQQRLAPLRLARLIEREPLDLLTAQRADE